jgi:hypothetical protein
LRRLVSPMRRTTPFEATRAAVAGGSGPHIILRVPGSARTDSVKRPRFGLLKN